MPGTVYLVGAGPGDPDLITLRGADLLGRADVVVYDGLANPVLLDLCPASCERIYAGKKHSDLGSPLGQREIEAILVDRARQGRMVVRLKGGDPFVFGRGGEEAEALVAAGIPFEIVPGVTAATAVPAYAGIPLTHRDLASTAVVLATGHDAEQKKTEAIDWGAVAKGDTIVLFMAMKNLADLTARLVAAGRAPSTPAAAIRWGTTANQRTVVGTLGDLAARVDEAALKPPALVIIGDVVSRRAELAWFEKRPLFGVRVLVPRQKEQARGFARVLVAHGAEPVICEVTHVVEADAAPLRAALARTYDWIAFASVNAVDRAVAALLADGRDARAFAGARLVAVGQATAQALRRHALVADLIPDRHDAVGVAEAILAHGGGRVLVPRAAEGREELVDLLTRGGAEVTALAAYRTIPAPAAELAPVIARLERGELDVLTFFSPSQVAALAHAPLARARVIAAIGATTADALRAHGVRVDLVPPAPSAEALADALIAHLRSEAR